MPPLPLSTANARYTLDSILPVELNMAHLAFISDSQLGWLSLVRRLGMALFIGESMPYFSQYSVDYFLLSAVCRQRTVLHLPLGCRVAGTVRVATLVQTGEELQVLCGCRWGGGWCVDSSVVLE